MKIHKTGFPTIIIVLIALITINCCAAFWNAPLWLTATLLIASAALFIFILSFFRNPDRNISNIDQNLVYAPADGKIVVIEPVDNAEYYNDKRIQISIFMSPLNVHVNRASIGGTIAHTEYYKGKHMPAWEPKSSFENERAITVIENENHSILLKQIAGAAARRVVTFTKVGTKLNQGDEFGFIKFGSRVDILLPPNATIDVNLNQVVKGNRTVIATLA